MLVGAVYVIVKTDGSFAALPTLYSVRCVYSMFLVYRDQVYQYDPQLSSRQVDAKIGIVQWLGEQEDPRTVKFHRGLFAALVTSQHQRPLCCSLRSLSGDCQLYPSLLHSILRGENKLRK